jgi:hypothetical protein
MKTRWKLFVGLFVSTFVLANAVSISAQKKRPQSDGQQVVIQQETVIQGPEGTPPPGDTFVFVASEMNFDGKLVKGAPYSAEAVTENTQTLSDGNRIVNKSTASVYRDSEGRTRREQTLKAIGPFAGETPQTIFINDPVAGVNYTLDSRTHLARKMAPMRFEFKFAPRPGEGPEGPPNGPTPPGGVGAPRPPERGEMIFERTVPPSPPNGEGDVIIAPRASSAPLAIGAMESHGWREQNAKTESLGKQNIEGVEAEGTRNTVTIPAGEIGNERDIQIISERWYSPELQTVVLTRHSDPRFGETVYKLTNINRSEPAKSLFEVPSDYIVKEGPQAPLPMRTRRPMDER